MGRQNCEEVEVVVEVVADVVVTPELLSEPEDVDAYVVEVDGGPLVDVD